MNYLFLANTVTVVHSLLIIGVLLGILISVRYKRFRPIEAVVLLLAIVIWSLYGGCPLTYVEDFLRQAAGQPTTLIQAGFIPYYMNAWFDLHISNKELMVTTYITASIFFLISMEWMSPIMHKEILKIRRFSRSYRQNRGK